MARIKEPNVVLGNRLRQVREEKNLQQKQAAYDLNISPQVMAHYEKGIREPDINTLNRIARYYDCTVDYLTGNSESKNLGFFSLVDEFSALNKEFNNFSGDDIYKKFTDPAISVLRSAINILLKHLSKDPQILEHYSNLFKLIDDYDNKLNNIFNALPNVNLPEEELIDFSKPDFMSKTVIALNKALGSDTIGELERSLLNEVNNTLPRISSSYKEKVIFCFLLKNAKNIPNT